MAARLSAIVLVALGLLPIANWLPGGETDPEYAARLLDWLNGLALCAGVGVLAWYLHRSRMRGDLRASAPAAAEGSVSRWPREEHEGALLALVAIAAFGIHLTVAWLVFSARPLLIDEIVQVMQARWYASGQLAVPTAEPREFFSILHLVDLGPWTYSQFPAGGPAMLALGALIGAEWLVGPFAGGCAVWLFGRLLREVEPQGSTRWRLATATLFALSPFGVFMFGSHMNHATTLTWLLLAMLALARATRSTDASPWWGLATGLALGVAATIRPVDGAAFALPAGAWLLWRARSGRRPLAALLLSGVGLALPLAALLAVNDRTTGEPFLFGYDVLWGAGHSLGFHASPWGPIHTPARGLELLSLYVTRLGVHLFETPFPAFLPAVVALWTVRRLAPLDRVMIASSSLLLLAYGAYWHDGYYLGPRFVFPLLPMLVLWSGRMPGRLSALRDWSPSIRRGFTVALVAGAAYALVTVYAVRGRQYRNGMTSMRTDVAAVARQAGVQDALVLVKESWGARLLVRMWALGVGRSDAEVLYRSADACKLELGIGELEREGVRGPVALERLAVLRADSSALVESTRSPDFTARMLPGFTYPAVCEAELARDQQGFSHFAPTRLVRDGNVYARWLPGREAEIAALHPGRPVFVMGRTNTAVDAPLTWSRWTP